MQTVKSGFLTDPANTNEHKRTTTGRDMIKLPSVPSMTLLTIEISGTAILDIEYSEDQHVFIQVAEVTANRGIQFAIPASVLATNVVSIGGGSDWVRVCYRTVTVDNIPSQTLIVFGGGTVTSPVVQSADHGNLTGLSDDDHTQYVLTSGARVMTGPIDLTGIAAGSPSVKAAATSDTPVVAFTDSGAANHAPTTAPAGYLEVLIGGVSRYIPFWA